MTTQAKTFKPLLAASLTDPEALKFPVLVSPKLDGIRALVRDGQLVSRTMKPIPNSYIRNALSKPLYNGFDGELVVGKTFSETTSAVMSEDGEPFFAFYVFDDMTNPDLPFLTRFQKVGMRIKHLVKEDTAPFIYLTPHFQCNTLDWVVKCEADFLKAGYEGLMIRSVEGIYKFGRSTEREGILLKMKRFTDIEAEVIGFEELMHNLNEAEQDVFGRTKRSSHKANLAPGGTLGALLLKANDGTNFKVGTGFDSAARREIWSNQSDYLGRIAKIKFQDHGIKDKPRLPVFLGWRDPIDI